MIWSCGKWSLIWTTLLGFVQLGAGRLTAAGLPMQGKAFAPPVQRSPPKRPVLRRAPGRASGNARQASADGSLPPPGGAAEPAAVSDAARPVPLPITEAASGPALGPADFAGPCAAMAVLPPQAINHAAATAAQPVLAQPDEVAAPQQLHSPAPYVAEQQPAGSEASDGSAEAAHAPESASYAARAADFASDARPAKPMLKRRKVQNAFKAPRHVAGQQNPVAKAAGHRGASGATRSKPAPLGDHSMRQP